MTDRTCGCSLASCGCCQGTQKWTPIPAANRRGLPALRYRVGTHGTFLETMKARLANMPVVVPSEVGGADETIWPLRGLTTRDPSDPAIALLDGWATVGDVLTFYEERIADEGYLRTATERRSIIELARLVGYELRPGVASSVYLAYTLEDKQLDPVEIPAGARSQSIPGPNELPQSFETSEPLLAHTEWNNLQVRTRRPQKLIYATALAIEKIYVDGTNTNLKTGDLLLLVFGDNPARYIVRTVAKAEGQFTDNRTLIHLQSVGRGVLESLPALIKFIQATHDLMATDPVGGPEILGRALEIFEGIHLGIITPPAQWADEMMQAADNAPSPPYKAIITTLGDEITQVLADLASGQAGVTTDPSQFAELLLKDPKLQPRSSLKLPRSLGHSFKRGSDATPQLLVNFAPRLKGTFYTAWANAVVNDAQPTLKGVFALRTSAPLFGSRVPKFPKFDGNNHLLPPNQWTDDWGLMFDEKEKRLFLDQAHEAILPDSFALIQKPRGDHYARSVHRVEAVETTQRTAYGISGNTTRLTLDTRWWDGAQDQMWTLRGTLVYAQSEALKLIEEPILEDVDGQSIELAGLYHDLTSGRWVILSGERADIPAVAGVKVSELLMISGLVHDYDPTLPGDKTHTTLLLATGTAYKYKRDTLIIYGNVVKATNGETRNETLGSGDGARPMQAFDLRQPPLTYVSAATPAGVESTLQIYVNDVRWHEVDTLAGLRPADRRFVTKTDDNAKTTVVFGDGEQGARPPTGVENIKAVYRSGIGKAGNLLAGQISMLQTRPLGVKEVINPLPATGGADKEDRDQARDNVKVALAALDRLVSLQDYAFFARTFAGIAKAEAQRLTDGRRRLVHLTIAGAADMAIDPTSDLYRNLLAALRKFGDVSLPVRVSARELIVLVLSARVRLLPDYLWEPVASEIRARLFAGFGFDQRALGQPALLCEVISLIQSVKGVAYVDVDAFGGIPEKKTVIEKDQKTGIETRTRRLLTLDEMTDTVEDIVNLNKGTQGPVTQKGPADYVAASLAGYELGILKPAQLAILTPAVPDTLIINQIV